MTKPRRNRPFAVHQQQAIDRLTAPRCAAILASGKRCGRRAWVSRLCRRCEERIDAGEAAMAAVRELNRR